MNRDSFIRLVQQNQTTLFRTARAILKNDQDAEDVVQDAICPAYSNLKSLRDAEKFKPWILRILVNQCYSQCRKWRPVLELEKMQDALTDVSSDLDERMTLWDAVLSLKQETRVVVTLFYYDCFSIREISGILGISEAAVKTRLSRGRTSLRKILREGERSGCV